MLIWQKGFEIAVQSFKLVETFPKEEKFSLSNQITRASVSIFSNIAEAVKYGDSVIRTNMLQNVVEEQKMLVSFMNKLNK